MQSTIDDVSNITEDQPPVPAIVMVAKGAAPASLVLPTREDDMVVAALACANHVVSVAARALGVHRTQLYRLIEEYKIERDDEGDRSPPDDASPE